MMAMDPKPLNYKKRPEELEALPNDEKKRSHNLIMYSSCWIVMKKAEKVKVPPDSKIMYSQL